VLGVAADRAEDAGKDWRWVAPQLGLRT